MTVHYNPGDRNNSIKNGLYINLGQYGNYSRTPSTGETLGGIGLSIFSQMLDIGSMAACYAIAGKAGTGSSGAPSSKQIGKTAQTIVDIYDKTISDEVNSFNGKYGKLGITIDSSGNTNKTYDEAKAELGAKITEYKNSIKDSDGKMPAAVEAYNNACRKYEGLNSRCESFEKFDQQIIGFNKEKIIITGDTAKAKPITQEEADVYKDYTAGGKGKPEDTTQYQNEKASRERLAETYNNLVKARENALGGLKDGSALNIAKNNAKQEMQDKGKEKAKGETTCAEYKAALEGLEANLNELGSKAEFNGAVASIKAMASELKDAQDIVKSKQAVDECDNKVKNTGKKGNLLSRLFSKNERKDDHKKAKEERAQARDNYQAMIDAMNQKYTT